MSTQNHHLTKNQGEKNYKSKKKLIDDAITLVTLAMCTLQARMHFPHVSKILKMTQSVNFFYQRELLLQVSKRY